MNDLVVFAKKDITGGKKKELEKIIEKMNLNKNVNGGYVYLLIDCSSSMSGGKLNQAKEGVVNFSKDAQTKGYSVGLIKFSDHATHLCEPVQEIEMIEKYVNGLTTEGWTHMSEAISLAHRNLRTKNGAKVIVIATDGLPEYPRSDNEREATLQAGEKAKKEGIDIIAIGTDGADQDFLAQLASKTELSAKVAWPHFGSAIALMAKKLPERRISANEKRFLE